jgi:hypothetical protein
MRWSTPTLARSPARRSSLRSARGSTRSGTCSSCRSRSALEAATERCTMTCACGATWRCRKARSASTWRLSAGAVRRHRMLHAGQFPGVRPVSRKRLRHRRFKLWLQDDRRGCAGGRRAAWRKLDAAGAVPLFPLRARQAASGIEQSVLVDLNTQARMNDVNDTRARRFPLDGAPRIGVA